MRGVTEAEIATQKKSLHASERDTLRVKGLRRAFGKRMATGAVKRLKFIDESGINIALTRLYGRGAPGQRVLGSVPRNYGQSISLLAALGVQGLRAPMMVEGAVDTEVFGAYVEQVLGPTLEPGDIVVMDNLAVHKVGGIEQAIEARGARVQYLPPYSPDLNPIEKCWAKIKTALRQAKARTREALQEALCQALLTISPANACAWFVHCGYPVH